jgi:hypothetical protein
MNCDEVFDLLTLPAQCIGAQQREQIERHLDDCSSCARLAEAISPAVELFAHTAEKAEQASWMHARETDWFALDSERDNSHAPRPAMPAARDASWQAMRLAVTLLIGITLGGLLYGRAALDRSTDEAPSMAAIRADFALLPSSQLSRGALESLLLTEACLPRTAEHKQANLATRPALPAWDLLAQTSTLQLACCTHCHSTLGAAAHERDAIAQVARSCQTCHLQ